MKRLFFIAITTSLVFSACKGNKGTMTDSSCNDCKDAVIRNYGDPALDGCGWVVDVSSTIYMPKNLAPEFHTDGLEVKIKYEELGRVNCGLVKDAHLSMQIEEIQKK